MLVRAPTEADFAAVLDLVRAADQAVYGDSDWTETDLRDEWEDVVTERFVVEADGRLAGFATFRVKAERGLGDGYVHPELRGRGVGARILDLYEERAGLRDGLATLESAALRGDGRADELFRSRGYAPARYFWRMLTGVAAHGPAPVWPDGVEPRPFDVDRHGATFHAALNEGFAEEWGHRPVPYEEFRTQRLGAPRFDPTLCVVAWDGAEIAGLSLNDWKRNGDWGWIGSLAVRPAWRRRGLGEALLRASFAEFARRGETVVALGVDAANPTGATRLYERVGMRILWEAVVYRKDLA